MKATNRLRVLRAEHRITQEQIAAKTHGELTQTRISLIENGHAEATDAEKRLLARVLKSTVLEVFPEAGADSEQQVAS